MIEPTSNQTSIAAQAAEGKGAGKGKGRQPDGLFGALMALIGQHLTQSATPATGKRDEASLLQSGKARLAQGKRGQHGGRPGAGASEAAIRAAIGAATGQAHAAQPSGAAGAAGKATQAAPLASAKAGTDSQNARERSLRASPDASPAAPATASPASSLMAQPGNGAELAAHATPHGMEGNTETIHGNRRIPAAQPDKAAQAHTAANPGQAPQTDAPVRTAPAAATATPAGTTTMHAESAASAAANPGQAPQTGTPARTAPAAATAMPAGTTAMRAEAAAIATVENAAAENPAAMDAAASLPRPEARRQRPAMHTAGERSPAGAPTERADAGSGGARPSARFNPSTGAPSSAPSNTQAATPSPTANATAQAHANEGAPAPLSPTAQLSAASIQPLQSGAPQALPQAAGQTPAQTAAPMPLHEAIRHIAHSAKQGKTRLEIQLEPAHLGRIHIALATDASRHIQIHLIADQSATRQLIEQQLPLLRHALAEQGLDLSGFSTGGSFAQGNGANHGGHAHHAPAASPRIDSAAGEATARAGAKAEQTAGRAPPGRLSIHA